MNAQVFEFRAQLTSEECITCGCVFAFSTTLKNELRRSHRTFYCPSGHGQVFNTETEAERLAKVVAERDAQLGRERAFRVVAEGQLADLRRRTAHGVCPCCKRTFANVARHMKTKHPAEVK